MRTHRPGHTVLDKCLLFRYPIVGRGCCNRKLQALYNACTVGVAQEVRAPDCGSGGRGFESHHPPQIIATFQAGVAKLAHALDLGSSGFIPLGVQVPPPAPMKSGIPGFLSKLGSSISSLSNAVLMQFEFSQKKAGLPPC